MNAFAPALQCLLSAETFVSATSLSERQAPGPEPAAAEVSEFFISEEEMEGMLKEFAKHGEKLDRLLTEDEELRNFESFFSEIQKALMSVGTFSEGGGDDEADFTMRRHVDASRILRVKTRVPVTREIAGAVLAACMALGSEHAVMFKGSEGRSVVFSNGDWCREE